MPPPEQTCLGRGQVEGSGEHRQPIEELSLWSESAGRRTSRGRLGGCRGARTADRRTSRRSSRLSIRSERSAGLRDLIRAAASSRASGSPSKLSAEARDRRQVGLAEIEVRTHGAGPVDEQGDRRGVASSGCAASGSGSGATGRTRSPSMPASPGSSPAPRAEDIREGSPHQRPDTGQDVLAVVQTRSSLLVARKASTESTTLVSGRRRTPSDVASAGATAAGSVSGASSHQESHRRTDPTLPLAARRGEPRLADPADAGEGDQPRLGDGLRPRPQGPPSRPTKLVISAGGPGGIRPAPVTDPADRGPFWSGSAGGGCQSSSVDWRRIAVCCSVQGPRMVRARARRSSRFR